MAAAVRAHEAALDRDRSSVGQSHRRDHAAFSEHVVDCTALHAHSALGEDRLLGIRDAPEVVREDREMVAPVGNQQRAGGEIAGLCDERERFVAVFLAVALDSTEQAKTIERADARQRRQRLLQSGSREYDRRGDRPARGAGENFRLDRECARRSKGEHRRFLNLNLWISIEVLARTATQLVQRDTVARDEAVGG
ncbi:MAG: hypothetical protein V4531_04195 [Actinomycetota bacterium]